MTCRLAVLTACALAVTPGAVVAQGVAELVPLHVIPTESQAKAPVTPDQALRVRLYSKSAHHLAMVLGTATPVGETLEYVFDEYPQLRGPDRTWLESTFMVDYDEPEFEALRQDLAAAGGKVEPARIVEYVANIVEESNDRAWDLASVVARRREGDCSEHAVLTAALARMQGIPARVVVGFALVSEGGTHGAFGHAWAETLDEGRWQVADAALFGLAGDVRYLPIGLVSNEGVGYGMDLTRLLQVWIDRVVVLGR